MPSSGAPAYQGLLAKLAGREDMTPREGAAVAFAESLATAHETMDGEFIARMRRHFSDPELVELGLVTGAFITLGRLHRAFDIAPMEEGAHSALGDAAGSA